MNRSTDPTSDTARHRREAVEWLLRVKPGAATLDDIAAFKAWCKRDSAHAVAFAQARRLWEALGPAAQGAFEPDALEHFTTSRQPSLGRRALLGGALASSALAACYVAIHPPLDLWPSLSELNADYRTATGERRQIALPNDIAIDMNTRTSIGVRRLADDLARIELIAGEGMITAGPHALEVVAAGGNARAANAVFNVRRDGDRVSVTCLEGEVMVGCRSASVSLAAQRQVSYSDLGLGLVARTDFAAVTSWREGFLVFQDTRLEDVIAEINRYRRGRIVVVGEQLGRQRVNGRFYLARLNEVVDKLRNAFGARVTNLPGGVVILS
jgi:transmembrane sensor